MLFVYWEVVFIWLLFLEWLFTLDLPSGASSFMSMPLSLLKKKKSQSLKVSEQDRKVLLNVLRHAL